MSAARLGRSVGVVTLLVGISGPASAHELKVFASQQQVPAPGAKTTAYLSWGHRLPVDGLVDASTLERYEVVAPDGSAGPLKAADTGLQENVVELAKTGLYRVVAARKPGVVTFVLDADGKRQMKRGPKSAAAGQKIDSSHRSTQAATALIVVGPPGAEPPTPVGLPVEVVPLSGPAAWTAGAEVRFRVLVGGKPMSAEVEAKPVGHKPDDAWAVTAKADADGVFAVRLDRAGTWVFVAKVKTPAAAGKAAEYDTESFTGTLTLEVRP
jgi:uncharacterized GH25 family protein